MNLNYIIYGIFAFFIILYIWGYYKSLYTKQNQKRVREKKYKSIINEYISKGLEEPILIKYKDLSEEQIIDINNLMNTCFPNLTNANILDKGISNDSLLWILFNHKKKIKGFIFGLESIELIQFLNSNGIEDLDLYSIINWNGIFIYNLCISPEYRKRGWATKLINEVLKWSYKNKKDYLHLQIDSDNEIAFKLYTKNKFVIDKESINPQTNKEIYTMLRLINSNTIANENSNINESMDFSQI